MIKTEQLVKILPGTELTIGKLNEIANALSITSEKYQIYTKERMTHFLAQLLHESGGFVYRVENMNYSAKGLRKTFLRYFTLEQAIQYARNPEMIGNRVYANRMGNGDEASGEGFKYRGRGWIQLTGKDNYEALSKEMGVNFVISPELLGKEPFCSMSAGWYWNKNKLNNIVDNQMLDDLGRVKAITQVINGGFNGLDDRLNWYKLVKANLA